MLFQNPITQKKGYTIVVGRGSVAIFLALKHINSSRKKVILPGNICYAAVFPIIYSGYIPVFCDVDMYSGNTTLEHICKKYSDEVCAILVPHMYGNPVNDMIAIRGFCTQNKVFLIEDCATMMGGVADNYIPGNMGDFVIYSTGYSKTVDLGIGGLLYSPNIDLSELEQSEAKLKRYNNTLYSETQLFSKIYRIIRNTNQHLNVSQAIFQSMNNTLRDSFIFSVSNTQKEQIIKGLSELNAIIEIRRNKSILYDRYFCTQTSIDMYKYANGSVPWRYNFYVDPSCRNDFIKYCLYNDVPISDWYPSVLPVFGYDDILTGVDWHESHIINIPLLLDDNEIKRISETIIHYFN